MKLIRIAWREAVKRFRFLRCRGCHKDDEGQDWYVTEDRDGPYCPVCAVKLATGEDTTRSINQFFRNTTGTQIAVELLEES